MEYANKTLSNKTRTTTLPIADGNILLLEQVQNVFSFIYIGIYLFGLIVVSMYAIHKEKNENTKQVKSHDKHNDHNNNTSNNSGIVLNIYCAWLKKKMTKKNNNKQQNPV